MELLEYLEATLLEMSIEHERGCRLLPSHASTSLVDHWQYQMLVHLWTRLSNDETQFIPLRLSRSYIRTFDPRIQRIQLSPVDAAELIYEALITD